MTQKGGRLAGEGIFQIRSLAPIENGRRAPMILRWKHVPWLVFVTVLVIGAWITWRCSGTGSCRNALAQDAYDWQALTAGVLALIAGLLSLIAIYNQTRSHEREANERRARLVRAYRAGLSDDLDAITNYALKSAEAAHEMLLMHSRKIEMPRLQCPSLSPSVIANLCVLIENHDAQSAEIVADIVSCYQIQHSRLEGEIGIYNPPNMRAIQSALDPTSLSTRANVVFTFFKTVELYVRATQMFRYARRQVDTIAPPIFDQESVDGALLKMGLLDALSEDERKRIRDAMRDQ
jgi:hypothetical protein